MRIGILSDIHANAEALLQVEAELRHLALDRIVCLGDVVGYGASPEECCGRIRSLADIVLLGNHDAAVAGRMDYGYYYAAARRALDWTKQQVSPATLDWLRQLPLAAAIGPVGFCHGSPVVPSEYQYRSSRSPAPAMPWKRS